MKKYIILSIVFGCTFIGFSQEDEYRSINENRLQIVQQRLQEAVVIEDYLKAANLQEEQRLRGALEAAYLKNENQQKIIKLKHDLIHCNCTPNNLREEMKDLQTTIQRWNNKDAYRNDNFVLNVEFSILNYLNTATNNAPNQIIFFDQYGNPYLPSHKRRYEDYLGLGLRIGSAFYFNKMEVDKDFKIGLYMNYFSLMVGLNNDIDMGWGGPPFVEPSVAILGFPQPGIIINKYFNINSGFEARATIGIVKSFGFDLTGMSGSVSVRYWIRNFAFGIDYRYATSIINESINSSRINQIGLTISIRN